MPSNPYRASDISTFRTSSRWKTAVLCAIQCATSNPTITECTTYTPRFVLQVKFLCSTSYIISSLPFSLPHLHSATLMQRNFMISLPSTVIFNLRIFLAVCSLFKQNSAGRTWMFENPTLTRDNSFFDTLRKAVLDENCPNFLKSFDPCIISALSSSMQHSHSKTLLAAVLMIPFHIYLQFTILTPILQPMRISTQHSLVSILIYLLCFSSLQCMLLRARHEIKIAFIQTCAPFIYEIAQTWRRH